MLRGSGRLLRVLLAVLGVAVLAGCASSGSPSQGVQWVVENEQQKAALQAQGFPQYTGSN
jgi:hypothetical protein